MKIFRINGELFTGDIKENGTVFITKSLTYNFIYLNDINKIFNLEDVEDITPEFGLWYRIFDKVSKSYVKTNEYHLHPSPALILNDKYVIERNTFLTASDSTYIFENDILHKNGCKVAWIERLGCWGFQHLNDDSGSGTPLYHAFNDVEKIEVLGDSRGFK